MTRNSFWQLYIHLVWSTKERRNLLRDELEVAAHEKIRETLRDIEMVPICVNSAWNHTHALVSWNPEVSVSEGVSLCKSNSASASIDDPKSNSRDSNGLDWQDGWAAFTVSPGKVEYAKWYVANQKSLHREGRTIDRYESLKGETD